MVSVTIDWFSILVGLVGITIIITGVTGNVLVVIAVFKKRSLRSTTNYLLVNMAIADIINLVSLPLNLLQIIKFSTGSVLLDVLCKFVMSYHLSITTAIVSILTLVVIAVERYNAICRPMRIGIRLKENQVSFVVALVWILSLAASSPLYIYGYYNDSKHACVLPRHVMDSFQSNLGVASIGLVFVGLPFIIITYCYSTIVKEIYFRNAVSPQNIAAAQDAAERRNVIKVSLSVTLLFFFCFAPSAISFGVSTDNQSKHVTKIRQFFNFVYILQSGINPLMYVFQSTNYRKAFNAILRCKY